MWYPTMIMVGKIDDLISVVDMFNRSTDQFPVVSRVFTYFFVSGKVKFYVNKTIMIKCICRYIYIFQSMTYLNEKTRVFVSGYVNDFDAPVLYARWRLYKWFLKLS